MRECANTDWWTRWAPGGAKLLDAVSLFYVFLPVFLFVIGWLRAEWAVVVIVLMVAAVIISWVESTFTRTSADQQRMVPVAPGLFARRVVLVVLVTSFVVACTGIGGYSYQFADYTAYDAILRDLIEVPWPGGFELSEGGDKATTAYYLGYYLPSAIVGKVFDWQVAYHFSYAWGVLGVLLLIAWFMRIAGSTAVWLALFFLFFGGLDVIGHLFTARPPWHPEVGWLNYLTGTYWWSSGYGWLDYWSANYALSPRGSFMNGVFFRFFSPLSFLVDGPCHILPGTLAVLMIFHDVVRRCTLHRIVLLWSTVIYASVFVSLGMFPFVVFSAFILRFQRAITLQNATGAVIMLIAVLYFSSAEGVVVSELLWNRVPLQDIWPILLLYYVAEFGILAFAVPRINQSYLRFKRYWLYLCIIAFLLGPWYCLGRYNDFSTKVIIPAQLLFMIYIAVALCAPERKGDIRWKILLVLLGVGALAPLGHVLRAVEFGFNFSPPPLSQIRHVNERLPEDWTLQGHANTQAFFWKHLAQEVTYKPFEKVPVMQSWDFSKPKDRAAWDFYSRDWDPLARGMRIYAKTENALMRLEGADFHAKDVGTVKLDVELENQKGKPIDGTCVLFWQGNVEGASNAKDWGFHAWKSNVIHPLTESVRANPYWRGPIKTLAVYLNDGQNTERPCQVILKRLTLYNR